MQAELKARQSQQSLRTVHRRAHGALAHARRARAHARNAHAHASTHAHARTHAHKVRGQVACTVLIDTFNVLGNSVGRIEYSEYP